MSNLSSLVDEARSGNLVSAEVFAIGDCAVSGKPPTAQVAYQQGLVELFACLYHYLPLFTIIYHYLPLFAIIYH